MQWEYIMGIDLLEQVREDSPEKMAYIYIYMYIYLSIYLYIYKNLNELNRQWLLQEIRGDIR